MSAQHRTAPIARTPDLVPLNTADNWSHFAPGPAVIALGVLLTRRPRTGADR
ncbi:hypothetical protein J7E91_03355 [Streptomyces sp. ISL-99]|uniref:DUF4383 domain-containing protein n=1 Tax=Streptomyces sp. ISL-99 TaxID=2819193 RepID=UPI001BE55477|nr:DUF4383 domain-containing protein [Streptomyces sp. ISL-99]MBT2524492.1 hypothetical protein [Streptomyces sp. ISL-99]